MFQINDKVVCIDDSPGEANGSRWLKSGSIYVIHEINIWPGGGFYLVGDPTPDLAWKSKRFRKLSDIKKENAAKQAENNLISNLLS
jgi:hypothetical protein